MGTRESCHGNSLASRQVVTPKAACYTQCSSICSLSSKISLRLFSTNFKNRIESTEIGAMSSTRLGLVRCNHCQRQFNPHSAARHIPWCKKQKNDNKRQHLSADKLEALERYRWRINYKPSNYPNQRAPYPNGKIQAAAPTVVRHYQRSSINSSISSPSASSTNSLNNSIASLANGGNQTRTSNQINTRPIQAAGPIQPAGSKLKRSVSSVTLTKRSGGAGATIGGNRGSALSKDSRTPVLNNVETPLERVQRHCSDEVGFQQRPQHARAKSVSDLTDMSELVELLAKRMEDIYLQNKQLLKSFRRGTAAPMRTAHGLGDDDDENCDKFDDDDDNDDDDNSEEFELCHHCRAKCALEANYCHKCGCRMRPSNPTPLQHN